VPREYVRGYEYNHTEKWSLSKFVDVDLPAGQDIPPIPLQEDHPPVRRTSYSKHHCIHNGHIFHAIDLKGVPDQVGINKLQVSPFLQSQYGIKQHVDVPIRCQKCNFSVTSELWECDIPACRLTVCRHCASDMEEEWQERAISGWKRG